MFVVSRCMLILGIVATFSCSLFTGCANIVPPEGGPRDSLPPVLIKALPADSVVQFEGNKIILTFNEFIQLDASQLNDIIISPLPVKPPVITGKLENVSVKLRDSLLPNTTYSINFGQAIKDVNEGNVYKDYTYVFSTGDTLSTGELTGQILLAETGKVDSTLIATLYTNLSDSAVKKQKPVYYTRLDGKGNFKFRFLPDGAFHLYAMPNDFSKKYDDSTKVFAFLDSSIQIVGGLAPVVQMYAFEAVKKEVASKQVTPEIKPNPRELKDTVKKITYNSSLKKDEQSLLEPLQLIFDKPVAVWDSTLISLTDTLFNPVQNYNLKWDSSFKIFSIVKQWQPSADHLLILDRYAFRDSTGVPLRQNDTLRFKVKGVENYGSIRLRFDGLDTARHPVLLLFNNSTLFLSSPLTGREFYRKLIDPGRYQVRILYDKNLNGVWDTGNYDEKLQPEIIEEVNQEIDLRSNWDNEVTIKL